MTKELTERLSVFLRYAAWVAIYALLYLGASFVAAYGLDLWFPASSAWLGAPASLWRVGAFLLWSAVVTLVIWPVWHGLGDLFLPERGRFARLVATWCAIAELRSALHEASGMAPRR